MGPDSGLDFPDRPATKADSPPKNGRARCQTRNRGGGPPRAVPSPPPDPTSYQALSTLGQAPIVPYGSILEEVTPSLLVG